MPNLRLEDVFLQQPRFMGVITPSGNTVVERVTMGILREFPQVTPLFSRTPVFGDADPFPQSYGLDGMLSAARLLAHARPEVIVWNGSKGGKIGVQQDRDLAAHIETETGVPATTSIMALDDVLRRRGLMRVAIVTPYDNGYQEKLVAMYLKAGFDVVGEVHASLADNLSFASMEPGTIAGMVREAASFKPDAVLALCTNFPAATVMPSLERELGIAMFDSASIGVWAGLHAMGIDTSPAAHWGHLFETPLLEY